MIFSCCDWDKCREEQPDDLENLLECSTVSKQAKRKDKAAHKDEHVFDIDSIMNGKAVYGKRTFTQSRILSGLMSSTKIQRPDASPATRP